MQRIDSDHVERVGQRHLQRVIAARNRHGPETAGDVHWNQLSTP
jgi:hypothetical protein